MVCEFCSDAEGSSVTGSTGVQGIEEYLDAIVDEIDAHG
jgi:hypothetical protein